MIAGQDNVYFAPFLLPWEAALLVLGVGVLAWRWRQPASFLVLLWGFGVVLTGGILVDATTIPSFAHWTPAFPAFYLALALPLAMWWGALRKLPVRTWRRVGAGALALFLALDVGMNAYAYLVQYPPRVPPDHSIEAAQGRFVESVEPNTDVYVGTNWAWTPLNPPIDEMMASRGTVVARMADPGSQLPVAAKAGRNLAFFFYNDMYVYMDKLRQLYPGGRAGEMRSPDGTLIGETYFVPASVLGSR